MTAGEFLGELIGLLDAAQIRYMVAGSFASSFHAEPRTTNDLDIVIEVDSTALNRLLGSIDLDRYYVSDEAAHDALQRQSSFNLIDIKAGWKADLIVRRDRRFSHIEFERRIRVTLYERDVFVASAEDTVLSKLEWAAKGGSDRQVRDAAAILRARTSLDHVYLNRWAQELGVSVGLTAARALAAGN